MGQPSRKPAEIVPNSVDSEELESLKSQAVAIDPPPEGAVGIRELLDRFESFAEAGDLVNPPENGTVGVRELLQRLNKLADAGYFSSPIQHGSDKP